MNQLILFLWKLIWYFLSFFLMENDKKKKKKLLLWFFEMYYFFRIKNKCLPGKIPIFISSKKLMNICFKFLIFQRQPQSMKTYDWNNITLITSITHFCQMFLTLISSSSYNRPSFPFSIFSIDCKLSSLIVLKIERKRMEL
jgi:hypothetical protein